MPRSETDQQDARRDLRASLFAYVEVMERDPDARTYDEFTEELDKMMVEIDRAIARINTDLSKVAL